MALEGYYLPQNRYINQPQAAVAAPAYAGGQLALPELTDEYANVQGTTDEFINTVGELKSYTHNMAKQYGIDVTQPDYALPGGGQPFRTFQELSAKALMTGNDLKTRMKENQDINRGVLAGNVIGQGDYQNAPLGTSIQDRAVSTQLLPEVRQASEALTRVYDTRSGAQRATQTFKAPLIAKLTAAMEADPQNATFYQRQIDALPDATYEPPQYNPNAYGGGATKNNGAILIKEITNIAQGRWKPGDYTKSTDENGDPIFINKARNGQTYGDYTFTTGTGSRKQEKKVKRVIDRWVKRPDGSVWLEFKQTEKGQDIPAERVDDTNSGSIASGFFSNVATYGKALEDAQAEGWIDNAGFVDYERVPSEGYATPDIASEKAKTDAAKADIRVKLKTATKANPLKLSVGENKIEIKPNSWGSGHYIEVNGEELDENLSEAELFQYLQKEGYFDQVINTPTEAPTTSPTAKYKTKGGQVVDYAKLQQLATNGGYPSVEDYIKRNGLTPAK